MADVITDEQERQEQDALPGRIKKALAALDEEVLIELDAETWRLIAEDVDLEDQYA